MKKTFKWLNLSQFTGALNDNAFKMTTIIVLIGLAAFAAVDKPNPQAPSKNETVVLLHGLCRTSRSMAKMEKALTAEGYRVINVDYPSRSAPIDELTEMVFQPLEEKFPDLGKVHFVTHSMGGILLREYLEKQAATQWLGNVVMLAPPSRGSEVTDKLGSIKLYQWINGPAGNQLGTGAGSRPLRLKAPEFELGIIAGDRSINPILSMLIPGPDDGKVSLARVKPAVYTDYIKLHVTHACMARNHQVITQTQHFLKYGKFNPKEKN